MFKKIKENPYYMKFKEMRADPKLKPITSLILWIIFIIIVVIFVRGTIGDSNKEVKTVNKNITNYEFTYTNNKGVIFGESYNDKLEFIYGGNRYYYNLENVYLIKNQSGVLVPNFDLNVLKITPKMINNLVGNLTYNVNGEAKEYTVPLSRFLNLYEVDVEADLSLANSYNIIVKVYENEKGIYMYSLDLTNYYNFRGLSNDGVLTIDIYNSKVHDFTKYYEELIGGVV